jgi:nicotinate-nucleotide pyrophosphorylase (carboxylating)
VKKFEQSLVDLIIRLALLEDLAEAGDITSKAIFPEEKQATAEILTKEKALIAGLFVAKKVFHYLDRELEFINLVEEGATVKAGESVARIKGDVRSILTGERTALNFLQRLSGIATYTAHFMKHVRNLPVKIYDTRKTSPGLRFLEKYAVRVGGGENHRFGLFDGILIKDNHIKVVGSIREAIERVKSLYSDQQVAVEVENLAELEEALKAEANIILLDNMSLPQLKEAVKLAKGQAILEASGGVRVNNIMEIAKTGIDRISIGALTQLAPAIDMSLKILDSKEI